MGRRFSINTARPRVNGMDGMGWHGQLRSRSLQKIGVYNLRQDLHLHWTHISLAKLDYWSQDAPTPPPAAKPSLQSAHWEKLSRLLVHFKLDQAALLVE